MNDVLESNPGYPLTDTGRRAGWAIATLLAFAFAALGLWLDLIPTYRVDPLDLLPAIISLQVLGAILLAAWLLWSPA